MIRKLLLMSALCALLVTNASGAENQSYVNGDVIVVLKNQENSGTFSASAFAENEGLSVRKIYSALSEAGDSVFALIHSDDIDPETYARELLKNPNVIAASPNYIVRAASVTPNDTYWNELWGLDYINMPDAWEIESGDASVYAAIMDSGIDWTNEDLAPNVAKELGTNMLTSGGSALDDYGHGTHVAGTMGAVSNNNFGVTGINWNIKMIPVKVLNNKGNGTTGTVIEGINYVIKLINQGYNIRVANFSLETYSPNRPDSYTDMYNDPLWQAFKNLDDTNKTVIVVAAGNHNVTVGSPTTRYEYNLFNKGYYVYPASFKGLNNLISVSAMNHKREIASYSNTNASISAPGGDQKEGNMILSTWINANSFRSSDGSKLNKSQGTSMASPHVAGAAALLAAHMPSMTAYQIKQCIMETRNTNYAEGLLDVAAALKYQENYSKSLPDEGNEELPNNGSGTGSGGGNSNDPIDNFLDNLLGGNGSGGGGCNGMLMNASMIAVLFVLVKKFMS